MVNGGGKMNQWYVTYLTNALLPLLRHTPDAKPLWGLLGRETEASRESYQTELKATVEALRCHPCIGCWVPFNEGWGQFDARAATAGEMWTPATITSTRSASGPAGGRWP